jgi:hypothetical protein
MDILFGEQTCLIKYLNVLRAVENIEKVIDYLQVKVKEKCGDTDLETFELDEYWRDNIDIFIKGRWYTYIVEKTELEVDEENNKTTLCITALFNH